MTARRQQLAGVLEALQLLSQRVAECLSSPEVTQEATPSCVVAGWYDTRCNPAGGARAWRAMLAAS